MEAWCYNCKVSAFWTVVIRVFGVRLFLKEDTSGSVTGTFAVRGPVGGARKRTV